MMSDLSPIKKEYLDNVIINGVEGEDVARTHGKNELLEMGDVEKYFDATPEEAKKVLKKVHEGIKREGLNPNSDKSFFVSFDHVPVCRTSLSIGKSGCYDQSIVCRPRYMDRSCFSVSASTDNFSDFPSAKWNPINHKKMRAWFKRLEMTAPETQVALFDCDNTILAGTIGPLVSQQAKKDGYGKLRTKNAPQGCDHFPPPFIEHYIEANPNFTYDPKTFTHHDNWDILGKFNPQLDADALSMGFAGMTIKEIADTVYRAKKANPKKFASAYPEMRDLVNALVNRRVNVGVVSSSPFIAVAIALKESGVKVPVRGIKGTDFYVMHPTKKKPVQLINLIAEDLLTRKSDATIDDVVAEYGHLKAMRMVDPVQNGQEGKGATGVSISWRSMDYWNRFVRTEGQRRMQLGDMRLVGYFGDNTAPFSDLIGGNSVKGGNDQGLIRTLIPKDLLVLNIRRHATDAEGKVYLKKTKYADNFKKFTAQLSAVHPDFTVVEQDGIYQGPRRGEFLTGVNK